MQQDERSSFRSIAYGDADELADAHVDRHAHAVNGATEDHLFAMKFDLPHAAIGPAVARRKTDGQ